MKLISTHGHAFELNIQGYQFPGITNDYWDSNWLLIEINVSHPRGSWVKVDPSMNTFEVARLADWMDSRHADAGDAGIFSSSMTHLAKPG